MRVATLFLIFSFSLVTPLVASEKVSYELKLAKGILALDQKDYQKAIEEFQGALREKPEDSKATLYIGIALVKSGKEEDGEKYLKEALKLDPNSQRANYELGLFYYKRGINEEAKDFFEVAKGGEEQELSELASYYLQVIGEEKVKVKQWSVNMTTGMQYDSNVVLASSDGALPEGISRKSDWRWILYTEGKYSLVMKERITISPTYSFYQSVQLKLYDYNVTQHLPGLEVNVALMKNLGMKLRYSYEYTIVDHERYVSAHTLESVLSLAEGKGFFTLLRYRYQDKNFNNTELFPTNTERNGKNNLFGVTQYIPLGRRIFMNVGYAYDKDDTDEKYWTYDGNATDFGVRYELDRGLSLDASFQYYQKRYKGIYPGTDQRRRDISRTYAINVTKALTPKISIIAGWFHERNSSNLELYDYKRDIVSLLVRLEL